ncbi:MAG: hypothetical protein H6719_16585 [Sandaracinaceae bacterium]|nr:hypothetical protein [Sandaracinaceae bacterium]
MRRGAIALVALAALGCDGFGRPIVGPVGDGDGGAPRQCESSPGCRPVPQLADDHFDVPHDPPEPTALDCDGDLVDDAIDNCLGVPNPTQGPTDCANASADCARLAAGETSLVGADLRGCRPGPIALPGDLSLHGADLSCADLAFTAPDGAYVDLREASVTSSRVSLSADRPATLEVSRTTLRSSAVSVGGAARLLAQGAIFEQTSLFVLAGSGDVRGDAEPALDVDASNLAQVTIWEAPARRAGRVRIERSSLTATRIDARVLSLYGVDVAASRLAADELDAQEIEATTSEIRTDRGAFASVSLSDVVFDRCVDLRFADSDLLGVDVPACEPERLHVFRSELDGCNLAGGAELVESIFLAGVLGGGPTTTLTARESELDGSRFCDLGAARFLGGELRCVHCDPDAFMEGASVCVSGTALFERGCPAVELAAACE